MKERVGMMVAIRIQFTDRKCSDQGELRRVFFEAGSGRFGRLAGALELPWAVAAAGLAAGAATEVIGSGEDHVRAVEVELAFARRGGPVGCCGSGFAVRHTPIVAQNGGESNGGGRGSFARAKLQSDHDSDDGRGSGAAD